MAVLTFCKGEQDFVIFLIKAQLLVTDSPIFFVETIQAAKWQTTAKISTAYTKNSQKIPIAFEKSFSTQKSLKFGIYVENQLDWIENFRRY